MAIILVEEVLMGLDDVKASLEQAMTVLDVLVDDLSPALGEGLRTALEHTLRQPLRDRLEAVELSKRRWMPWPPKVQRRVRSPSWSASSACASGTAPDVRHGGLARTWSQGVQMTRPRLFTNSYAKTLCGAV